MQIELLLLIFSFTTIHAYHFQQQTDTPRKWRSQGQSRDVMSHLHHKRPLHNACPCLIKPDGTCLSYDPRFMAMDLEEAMVSFPDLLMTNPPDPVDVRNPGPYSSPCLTEECVSCQEDIRRRLTQIGMAHFNVPKRSKVRCNRYYFSNDPHRGSYEDYGGRDSDEDSRERRGINERIQREHRQVDTDLIGTRFNLSCIGKGVVVGEEGLISLCSSCWTWRRLPSNYMPSILNELICDHHDDACLSGYAKCKEGMRNLEVIRNDSGILTTVILTSGTYCECRAKQHSPIYNLIVGSGVNGKRPPF